MSAKKKDPVLPHMINLIVGDWSGDGHSMTETVTIRSNLKKKDVEKAYAAGVKKKQVKETRKKYYPLFDRMMTLVPDEYRERAAWLRDAVRRETERQATLLEVQHV